MSDMTIKQAAPAKRWMKMRALITPRTQEDVRRNREIILEHIRGLVAACKIIREEERAAKKQ